MKKVGLQRSALAFAVAVASTSYTQLSLAQSATALEEVVVTARKRSENLQDVPMSISAFSGEQLRDAQIDNLVEIGRMSPNVQVNETSGLQSGAIAVYMRGIGNNPGYDQGIGIYVDDVYLNRTGGALMDVFNVERIEILKGPQGNLYGRNTIGGAIKYITREPDEETRGNVEVKVGDEAYRRLKGSFSGALSDTLFASFAFSDAQRDGWQNNLVDGKDYWDLDTAAYRGTIVWRPSEDFKLKFAVDYMEDESAPYVPNRVALNDSVISRQISPIIYTANLVFGEGTGVVSAPSDLSLPSDVDGVSSGFSRLNEYGIEQTNYALTAEWAINDAFTLKSVTAYRDLEQNSPYDFDGSGQQWIDTMRSGIASEDWSQELQLNYTSDNVAAVLGLYYLDGDFDQGRSETLQSAYLRVIQFNYKDTYQDARTEESKSIYGNIDWDVTDRLQLSLGARYTEDEKEEESKAWVTEGYYALAYSGFVAGGLLPMAIAPGAEAQVEAFFPFVQGGWATPYTRAFEVTYPEDTYGKDKWEEFTPSARIKYQINDDMMVYAGYSEGFKSGGFNRNSASAAAYEPETVATYSVGLKATLFDETVRFNTEYFYNEYEEKQMQSITLENNQLVAVTRNVGEVSSQGIEAELTWLTPLAGLMINANIGYLDQEVDKYETLDNAGNKIDVANTTALGYAPEWSGQIRAIYQTDIGDAGTLTLGTDVSYQDEMYLNSPIDLNNPLKVAQRSDSYYLWNAMAAFETADGHWRFAAEGKNLNDERELVNTFDIGIVVTGGYTAPRFWSVSAEYMF